MDLKIKCSKCEIYKSKIHYLGYPAGTNSVQPLPLKVTTIQALEPSKNIEELWHFLGLVRFLQEVHPIVCQCNCLPQHKGAEFKWTEQYNNAFNLLKSDLVKMAR